MSIAGRQIYTVPAWATSGTAEVVTPAQATRDAGLAIGGEYPYQTANWLYRTHGENLGEVRDRIIFSDILPGFYAQTAIGTTGAGFTNVRVCGGDAFGTSPSYFVSGLNTSANAYEVYAYTAGAPTIYSNTLPAAMVVHDIIGDTSGNNRVMVVGASGTTGKAYRASAANTWTDVTATLFSGVTTALRKIVRMNTGGSTSVDFMAVVGDAGQVFVQNNFNLQAGFAQVTPPTGMSAVNFGAAAVSGNPGGTAKLLFFGDSRHIMTYAFPTVAQISNAFPSSVSAIAGAAGINTDSYMVAGGSRTDGKGFIAYSTDKGQTWSEIDPDIHGIASPISDLKVTQQGGFVAVAGGTLYGGHPDELNAWKQLTTIANVTDVTMIGNRDCQLGEEPNLNTVMTAAQIIIGVHGTTPARVAFNKSRWITGGRTF